MQTNLQATIGLEALTVDFHIGVSDEERAGLQPVRIQIWINTDIISAMMSDDIKNTVDYSRIRANILDLAKTHPFKLVERLAGEIATFCFVDERVSACKIRVEKTKIFPDAIPFVETGWINRKGWV